MPALYVHYCKQCKKCELYKAISAEKHRLCLRFCSIYVRQYPNPLPHVCQIPRLQHIKPRTFGGSRIQDLVNLHDRLSRLKFRIGYDADRFIADFEQILEDYSEIGTTYSEDYKKTLFLQKIEGVNDSKSPFFTFFNTVATLPSVTFDYIKDK